MRFLPRPTLYKSTPDNPADPAKFLQNSPFHVKRRPSGTASPLHRLRIPSESVVMLRAERNINTVNSPHETLAGAAAMSAPGISEKYDAAMKLKNSDLQACINGLKAIVQEHPEHVQSHMALAVCLHKHGHFDDAIHHAKKVTELEPNDAFSFTQLSVIYQRCGKIFEAEDAMARARMIQGTTPHH